MQTITASDPSIPTRPADYTRARADVTRHTTRRQGRTSTTVRGRGYLATLAGEASTHVPAGRVPLSVWDDALERCGSDGDALARWADSWAAAHDVELPTLIGSERFSWSAAVDAPTDPAIIASLAQTRCGITGGLVPHVDAAVMPDTVASPARARRTFPTRRTTVSRGARLRSDERPRVSDGWAKVTIRERWDGPAHVETVRAREILALPSLIDDYTVVIGHGRPRPRTLPRDEQRAVQQAQRIADAVHCDDDDPAAALERVADSVPDDARGVRIAWSCPTARGTVTVSKAGRWSCRVITDRGTIIVRTSRTRIGMLAAAARQLAAA